MPETTPHTTPQDGVPGHDPAFVSVIIPAFNGAGTIREQLDALCEQTYLGEYEVVVVDNGSTDETPQIVDEYTNRDHRIRLVPSPKSQGTSAARNAGAAAAKGDFLAYCDQDDVASKDWLCALVEIAPQHHAVGGPVDYALLNEPAVAAWRGSRPENHLVMALDFLPFAIGTNFGIWAEVLSAVGGWDTSFKWGGEDIDLSWRIQLAGYRLAFAADAVMHYRHRDSLEAMTRQAYKYGQAGPQLYSAFHSLGARRRPILRAARTWAWLLVHLPDGVMRSNTRGIWLWAAAMCLGKARGSVRNRVLYL